MRVNFCKDRLETLCIWPRVPWRELGGAQPTLIKLRELLGGGLSPLKRTRVSFGEFLTQQCELFTVLYKFSMNNVNIMMC